MSHDTRNRRRFGGPVGLLLIGLLPVIGTAAIVVAYSRGSASTRAPNKSPLSYRPKRSLETSGFFVVIQMLDPWPIGSTLAEIGQRFQGVGYRDIEVIETELARGTAPDKQRIDLLLKKAALFLYEGEPDRAYHVLKSLRTWIESKDELAEAWLYSVICFQGVTVLRRGENDNCIACRGESSCILPISPAAVHVNPAGSRLAIRHFTEHLARFPDDLEVRWLLKLAHMTLGEYPSRVDPRGFSLSMISPMVKATGS